MEVKTEPRVYVVIVNWNGWADTIECLESVFRQHYMNFQVVICDNDSADHSLARIRAWADGELNVQPAISNPLQRLSWPPVPKPIPRVEYDRAYAEAGGLRRGPEPKLVLVETGANLGFAGGNNVGLRYALKQDDAAYVWLLNNDTVVDQEALAAAVLVAERDDSIGMVGAKLLFYDRPGTIQAVAGGKIIPWQGMIRLLGREEEDRGQWSDTVTPDYITGASLLVKADVVRTIGLLDEQYFMYAEELDWCLRARKASWRLIYSPGSSIWHKEGKSVRYRSPLHDFYAVRSTLLWVKKFYPRFLPAAFLYSLYRGVLPKIIRFQPARLAAVLRAYRSFFFGAAA
ncbi:glycosyltransferase family 2 protein [soil metagenome]